MKLKSEQNSLYSFSRTAILNLGYRYLVWKIDTKKKWKYSLLRATQ